MTAKPHQIERLLVTYRETKSVAKAAVAAGVSTNSAYRHIERVGLALRPRAETYPRHLTHGHTVGKQSKTYECWANMMKRCYNPKAKDYRWYGAKAVKVCERWHTFANFLADMGEQPFSLTLERINRHSDYEPSNCYWATRAQQQANQTHDCGSRKLTAADVQAIRTDDRSCAKIAHDYAVVANTIWLIRTHQTWRFPPQE